MIRPITSKDEAELIELADSVGLFGPAELAQVGEMIADHLRGSSDNGEFWLVDEGDDELAGVAFCAPERMTSGTWNVLLIAVRPDRQKQGRGAALMNRVEETLAARGERLLLVETLASMEEVRAFYRKCGYEEEARIRDYYDAGQDKIVFRKVLKTEDA